MKKKFAFTLIELLIVVAIIAILAAIAVPNFLEAQTRSKVSRVKADMRTFATCYGIYYVDNNKYTWDEGYDTTSGLNILDGWFIQYQFLITTPIAYCSTCDIIDPFLGKPTEVETGQIGSSFRYYNLGYGAINGPGINWGDNPLFASVPGSQLPQAGYAITSYGPDRKTDGGEGIALGYDTIFSGIPGIDRLYDSTNGTVSSGDIVRTGGITIQGNAQQ